MAIDKPSGKLLKKLGLRLRGIRESKGWTLEYAEERGVKNWQHLQQIESGKKNINFTTLIRLCKVYRISPSELLKEF